MTRTIRFPIAGLMGVVLVVALGLTALRSGSVIWAGVTYLLTCAVLGLAVVGIICRGNSERAWWLGFALFGWGYLLLAFCSSFNLPTMTLLDTIAARLGAAVQFSGGMGGGMGGGGFGGSRNESLQEIAGCLWALTSALLGGVIASTMFGDPSEPNEQPETLTHAAPPVRRTWSYLPAVLGIVGCVIIVMLGLLGSRSVTVAWAGAAFLLTCGLLGMTIMGVAGSEGKVRQIWLGAALFGVGYMTMAFGRSLDRETWPSLPTDHMLNVLRPFFPAVISGFPPSGNGTAAANARIHDALEKPVPMPFPQDTPLEEILKYMKAETAGPDGRAIPIYVDPIGLQEAEKTITSTASIDLEGVALRTSLRLCLEQLYLTYSIRDGLLLITSREREVTPVYQDPFLIIGHCLLALLAAGFGGIVSPVFWARATNSPA